MANSFTDDTTIVIAAFTEGAKIHSVVSAVREIFPRVVVVDDGSLDDTFDQAQSAGATALRHSINRGQGAALQTGITWALDQNKAKYVVTFDADGQHLPSDALAMVQRLHENEDIDALLGSRFLGSTEKMPTSRRILLRLATIFSRMTTGLDLTDAHNGLRVFRAGTAARMRITMDRMAHASEILDELNRIGARVKEHPVRIIYTDYSLAKGQRTSAAGRVLYEYILGKMSK